MAGWTALLWAYILGGITFIPLVVAAVFAHAYYTLPIREDILPTAHEAAPDDLVQPDDDLKPLKAAQQEKAGGSEDGHEKESKSTHQETDTAAGYFAVCREYVPMGINAKPIERSTPVGSATVAAPSQSVYQNMYKSIFERKPVAGPLDGQHGASQRPKKAGNVFYVVLRLNHLLLFDDDDQLEVRHVISLANHVVSIYSGGDVTPEGELYIKRNALCLSRRTEGVDLAPDSQLSKPFYLFSENCSAKEDFYFAMLRNQEQNMPAARLASAPLAFDVKNIISLVQRLHGSEENAQTRWLNAMIGRIFLGVYRTADLENYIREKLTKKISRVKKPSFLSNIRIRKIETGDSAPFFTNIRHKDLTVEGECGMEADMKYTGNFRLEVAAVARIDLGSRIKAREVNLVLSVLVRKVEGRMLFKIKPPPSNRIWMSFQQMPKIEMTVEPIVSARQITYTVILRQIENRIKEVIGETLVLPFWDDIPFFKTEHKRWRGGIFAADDAVESSPDLETVAADMGDIDGVEQFEARGHTAIADLPHMEKSHSVPNIEPTAPTGLFGRKLRTKTSKTGLINGSSISLDEHGLPKSEVTTSLASVDAVPRAIPRPQRSPSFISDSQAVVGTDSTHADVFKPSSPPKESMATSMMSKLSARSQGATPSSTPLTSPRPDLDAPPRSKAASVSSKEASDKEIEGDLAQTRVPRKNTASSTHSAGSDDKPASATLRGFFLKRENSSNSMATSSSGQTTNEPQQKRMTLTAVANAADMAKKWGWNQLHKHEQAKSENRNRPGGTHSRNTSLDLSKPMGGGRPLPPPGVPLPMPDKVNTLTPNKRKPVPAAVTVSEVVPALPKRPEASKTENVEASGKRKSAPPPLPSRRNRSISEIPNLAGHDGAFDVGHLDESVAGQGEGLLVVAAPAADSEPTTPLTPEHARPVVEDKADDTAGSAATAGHPVSKQHDESAVDAVVVPAVHLQEPTSPTLPDEPLVATPAADAQEDEDEYSAWMDNPGEAGHEHQHQHDFVGSQRIAH